MQIKRNPAAYCKNACVQLILAAPSDCANRTQVGDIPEKKQVKGNSLNLFLRWIIGLLTGISVLYNLANDAV